MAIAPAAQAIGQDAHALGPASGEDGADQRRHDADADDGAGAGRRVAGGNQRIRQQETRAVGQRQRHGGQQIWQKDVHGQPIRQLRFRILGRYEMTGRETGRSVHGWRRSGRIVGEPPLSLYGGSSGEPQADGRTRVSSRLCVNHAGQELRCLSAASMQGISTCSSTGN